MRNNTFNALVVREAEGGEFVRSVEERRIDDLPAGDVLIRVEYSSLNYKDALSASGNKGITRTYPHTPGIDAAGVVEKTGVGTVSEGDRVIVHGYDLGMNTAGGFSEYIRVPSEWVVPLPNGLSTREAMCAGTAGFTAALCASAIRDGGINPTNGPVVVSGASGGVGCTAIRLLAMMDFEVTAMTGKLNEAENLKAIGATTVLDRESLIEDPKRYLLKGMWAAGIDTVGGAYLDSMLRGLKIHGVLAACGNAASPVLNTNVYPFILRGVRLQGIDSAHTPIEVRKAIWQRLGNEWKLSGLDAFIHECTLSELNADIDIMLRGAGRGRLIVRIGS
jgi:acrylyl-CoA reductase (NADPH)